MLTIDELRTNDAPTELEVRRRDAGRLPGHYRYTALRIGSRKSRIVQ